MKVTHQSSLCSCCGNTARAWWSSGCASSSRMRALSPELSWCKTSQGYLSSLPAFAVSHQTWSFHLVPSPGFPRVSGGGAKQATCVHPARALIRSFCCSAGIYYGTMLQRLDAFVLRSLKAVKEPLKRTVSSAVSIGHKGLQATAGRVTDGLVGRHVPDQLASQMSHLSTSTQDSSSHAVIRHPDGSVHTKLPITVTSRAMRTGCHGMLWGQHRLQQKATGQTRLLRMMRTPHDITQGQRSIGTAPARTSLQLPMRCPRAAASPACLRWTPRLRPPGIWHMAYGNRFRQ